VVVTKLDRLTRSLPDARVIAAELTRRQVRLSLGGSAVRLSGPSPREGAMARCSPRTRLSPATLRDARCSSRRAPASDGGSSTSPAGAAARGPAGHLSSLARLAA
jgi:hypothetical protein